MEMTLTLKELGFILIVGAVFVLVIYCIGFMKNLILTIKHTNKILEDTEVITAIAAERAQDVNQSIEDITTTVSSMAEVIKGNQSTLAAVSTIVNSLAALKNIFSKKKQE